MNEDVKNVLENYSGDCLGLQFPYFRSGEYRMTSCKEIGCRFEIWTDCVVVRTDSRLAKQTLDCFKKLTLACKIPLKETDLELAKIKNSNWIIIRGWWARNVLRRELCRLVLRSGHCNTTIEKVLVGTYKEYFFYTRFRSGGEFSSNKFKDWVESIKNFKVDKTLGGSGFFKWVKQGKIK